MQILRQCKSETINICRVTPPLPAPLSSWSLECPGNEGRGPWRWSLGIWTNRTKTQGLQNSFRLCFCGAGINDVKKKTNNNNRLQLYNCPSLFSKSFASKCTCLLRWPHLHRRRLWCGRWCCSTRWTCPRSATRMPRCQDGKVLKPGCCPACHLCFQS